MFPNSKNSSSIITRVIDSPPSSTTMTDVAPVENDENEQTVCPVCMGDFVLPLTLPCNHVSVRSWFIVNMLIFSLFLRLIADILFPLCQRCYITNKLLSLVQARFPSSLFCQCFHVEQRQCCGTALASSSSSFKKSSTFAH